MREFELIQQLTKRLSPRRSDTLCGIGDDAALLSPPAGQALVVTTDTLIAGRHFPADTSPFDIGYKSLAVNLSDLAAMAAEPAWVTLSLATPQLEPDWCHALIDGACAATEGAVVDIVGGDTTRGDTLTLGVTAIGFCPPKLAVRRSGAQLGDVVAVTGTLGDAAAGLSLWNDKPGPHADPHIDFLLSRLYRPSWRRGTAMRGRAHAAADISDGLLADLGHILTASGVGAQLFLDQLPTSTALRAVAPRASDRWPWQLSGGDDYELCMALPREQVNAVADELGCALTVIGDIQPIEHGLRLYETAQDTTPVESVSAATGWDHFA